jgi:hypothetical protein
MKTKKEHLTAYSDGTYRQFLGCSNILQAMEDYAKQQVSGYIRALKSVKGCDTKKYRRCFLWPSLNYGCAFCPKNNENRKTK